MEYPKFVETMMGMQEEDMPDRRMQMLLGHMQMTAQLVLLERVSEENVCDCMELLIEARKYWGSQNELVVHLEEECERYMSELDKEIYELERRRNP